MLVHDIYYRNSLSFVIKLNIPAIILLLPLLSDAQVQVNFVRYPPPWTKTELKESDKLNFLGYCAEAGKRCGHTDIKGGMGGHWIHCCPGLWCSPFPDRSKDLYSISCKGGVTTTDKCWYYEYPFEKFICKRDNYYPPLPIDYKREDKYDNSTWLMHFPDEN